MCYDKMHRMGVGCSCAAAATLLFFVVSAFYLLTEFRGTLFVNPILPSVGTDNVQCVENCALIIKQRNMVSRQLNLHMQRLGQLQCASGVTAGTGGWCRRDSAPSSAQHQTDGPLAQLLPQLLRGKSVASFGDGPGNYKRRLTESGLLTRCDAYDGAPFVTEVTNGSVQYLDLSVSQYGLLVYDWVLSLEVAEHIPLAYEDAFLDNVVRHAAEGVILSWAVPGQSGHQHVNLRTATYVRDKMRALGFERDDGMSEKLRAAATLWWLKKNTFAYRRRSPPPADFALYA